MSAPASPAGWYPTPEGNQRYWDGTQWTDHVVPDPSGAGSWSPTGAGEEPASPRVVGIRSLGPAGWLGWGGLVFTALLGAASSGVGGFFGMAGIYVLVVAIVALVRGHVDWARLRGRVAGGVALGTAFALFAVAGATAGPSPSTQVAAPGGSSSAIPRTTESPESSTPTSTTTTETATSSRAPAPTTSPASPLAANGTALAALAQLPTKGRGPKTGYSREAFGQAWADVDRNGCDTRNDILRRDLKNFTLKAGTNGCLVLSGTLLSPYTGKTISFVRGQSTSTAVQIDHVVALSDAWQKGAQQLDVTTRTAFANDPLNLLAVDGPTNEAKGDGDAATWLPPSKSYRCAYVARQVAVKVKYRLWVTAAEHDAIARILQSCPSQTLPVLKAIPLGGGTVKTTTATPKPTSSPQPAKPTAGLDPMFGTCKAAKAAGYGPYYAGRDPEYNWYRDADHDGVVCE